MPHPVKQNGKGNVPSHKHKAWPIAWRYLQDDPSAAVDYERPYLWGCSSHARCIETFTERQLRAALTKGDAALARKDHPDAPLEATGHWRRFGRVEFGAQAA